MEIQLWRLLQENHTDISGLVSYLRRNSVKNRARQKFEDQTVTFEPIGLEQNQFDFWNLRGRIRLDTKFGHIIRKSTKSI